MIRWPAATCLGPCSQARSRTEQDHPTTAFRRGFRDRELSNTSARERHGGHHPAPRCFPLNSVSVKACHLCVVFLCRAAVFTVLCYLLPCSLRCNASLTARLRSMRTAPRTNSARPNLSARTARDATTTRSGGTLISLNHSSHIRHHPISHLPPHSTHRLAPTFWGPMRHAILYWGFAWPPRCIHSPSLHCTPSYPALVENDLQETDCIIFPPLFSSLASCCIAGLLRFDLSGRSLPQHAEKGDHRCDPS